MNQLRATSLRFRITHVLWSLALVWWSGRGVWIAGRAHELWHPDATGKTPVFATAEGLATQIELAFVAATSLRVLAALAGIAALIMASLPRWSFRTSPYTLLASLPAATSPALITAMLPPEDPYTGYGSPMATLLSIMYLTVLGTALALPGFCLYFTRVIRPVCVRLLARLEARCGRPDQSL